jgi:hypothetical protein
LSRPRPSHSGVWSSSSGSGGGADRRGLPPPSLRLRRARPSKWVIRVPARYPLHEPVLADSSCSQIRRTWNALRRLSSSSFPSRTSSRGKRKDAWRESLRGRSQSSGFVHCGWRPFMDAIQAEGSVHLKVSVPPSADTSRRPLHPPLPARPGRGVQLQLNRGLAAGRTASWRATLRAADERPGGPRLAPPGALSSLVAATRPARPRGARP